MVTQPLREIVSNYDEFAAITPDLTPDVREVLNRIDDFALGKVITPGMPWGAFLMTVDSVEQHALERRLLESVVKRPDDIEAVRRIAADESEARLRSASGRLDVVTGLAEPVVVRIATEYFGIPPLKSPDRMARVMRDLAGIIMVNPPEGSELWSRSRQSIVILTEHLRTELAAKKSQISASPGTFVANDLFSRLVQLLYSGGQPTWFDEDWIRRYLTGLVATGAATVVRATTQAVDQFLAHPAALREAQRYARMGPGAQQRDILRTYLYEALRFRPMLPLLVRDCLRDTTIADGTKRARAVPAGTRILAAPLAAMFDPEAFPKPERFDPARPRDSYVHFGHGPRYCFGEYVADTAMLEMIPALLRLGGLARAAGSQGRVRYEGPVCASLIVTFARSVTQPIA